MRSTFTGVGTALITPFTKSGTVDGDEFGTDENVDQDRDVVDGASAHAP